MAPTLRLKVAGLGQSFEWDVEASTTVAALRARCATALGVGPEHVKLVVRGKTFTDAEVALADAGLADRTRVMLLHTPAYHADSAAIEALRDLRHGVDELLLGASASDAAAREERLTQILCKLDAVDGGPWVRAERRAAIRRIEDLSRPHSSSTRDDDTAAPLPAESASSPPERGVSS
mmetsp:Transcript_278/g.1084  ORF Transcript_278/g.1084 Transcript_278/m.1084 type:complete len:178 (-) Transcript_278:56-589(-)